MQQNNCESNISYINFNNLFLKMAYRNTQNLKLIRHHKLINLKH